MKKRLVSILLIFSLLLCLSACGEYEKDAELRVPLSVEPQFLDPQVVSGRDARTVALNCYEGLMKLDENGNPVPAAATNVSVSSDGRVYTFTLDGKSKWHINSNHVDTLGEDRVFEEDGVYKTDIDMTVTAADFVFGLRRAIAAETKANDSGLLLAIKNYAAVNAGKAAASTLGIEALDAKTLRITLEYPSTDFLRALAEPVSMPCNEMFFNACKGKYGMSAETVLCNGSFYLSRWYEEGSIVLRRNPDNERADDAPYSLTFAFTNDPELIMNKLESAEYDAAPVTENDLAELNSVGCKTTEIRNRVFGLIFNCSDPLMRSTALRLALCTSSDFSVVAPDATMKATATGIIPPSCILGGKSFAMQANATGILAKNDEKARKFFAEALTNLNVTDIEITLTCDEAYEKAARQIIQQWQKALGIHLIGRVEVLSADKLSERVTSNGWQAALCSISSQRDFAVDFLKTFTSGNPDNLVRYSSAGYDKLISQLSRAATVAELLAGCEKAQSFLLQNGVLCPLFLQSSYYANAASLEKLHILPSGSGVIFADTERRK